MLSRFAGKVAIVTGATSGMGKATAIALANAGASVVVAGINEAEGHAVVNSITKSGKIASFFGGDLSQEKTIESMVKFTVKQYGKLDMACNNAGVELMDSTLTVTREKYDFVFNINTWGVLAAMKHEIPEMLKVGGGSIVNIASIAGLVGFNGLPVYDGSKHAVQGMTKSTALEFAKQGIRVNSIAPGVILTPMVERAIVGPEMEAQFKAAIPMGRFGLPDDIANAVLFLLDPANNYVTGSTITVDGGWTAQ